MKKMSVLTQSKEDYLEAILVISLEKKWVRVSDLADYLGVKMSSVAAGIRFLAENGLVNHEKYGYIELTREGVRVAKQIYARHKTLYKFLHDFLGLSEPVAWRDACRMEHVLDARTMKRLLKFLEFIETCPEGEPLWLSNFHSFLKTGKRPEPCLRREK
ncbi:MAG: metal-dependent transcriptional regulator [Clostridia bacterium]|jgi:DtxR family Mn-dependent transcriptional regulator|nr:metal-dependent transcriptional regulator [Clostridia bacterium]